MGTKYSRGSSGLRVKKAWPIGPRLRDLPSFSMQRVFEPPDLRHALRRLIRIDVAAHWARSVLIRFEHLLRVRIVDRRKVADQHGDFADLIAAPVMPADRRTVVIQSAARVSRRRI